MLEHERLIEEAEAFLYNIFFVKSRKKVGKGFCFEDAVYLKNAKELTSVYEQAYTALLAYHETKRDEFLEDNTENCKIIGELEQKNRELNKAIEEKNGIIQDIYTATQRTQKLYDIKKARFKKEIQKLKE